ARKAPDDDVAERPDEAAEDAREDREDDGHWCGPTVPRRVRGVLVSNTGQGLTRLLIIPVVSFRAL
ncbi:MAG TPA: hypothetical protein PLU66_02685, partial [Trueperaceae bacterium]|nr:hypothetical protein [Trueperaceae bacterium]